jgi:hypothetical protein
MATVKFSKELQSAIEGSAKSIFAAKLERHKQNIKTEWFDTIYNRVFAQYIPHMNALPDEFFSMRSKLNLVRFGSSDMQIQFLMPREYKFPHDLPKGLMISRNSWRDELAIADDNQWGDLAGEIYGYQARVRQIENECAEFVEAVRKVTTTYSTLAPALKAWPPLWDLLPEEAKERHKAITQRTKNDATLDIDLSKFTSTVIAHKLTK